MRVAQRRRGLASAGIVAPLGRARRSLPASYAIRLAVRAPDPALELGLLPGRRSTCRMATKTVPEVFRDAGYFTFNNGKDDYNFACDRSRLYATDND